MTIKHTPGPWIAGGGEGGGNTFIRTQDGVWVASAVFPIQDTDKLTKEQALANANLLEAAPELLEALTDLLESLGYDPYTPTAAKLSPQVNNAKTAIQKATGGTQ